MTKRMLKTLESTRFANCPIIPVAAKPGGPDATDTGAEGIEATDRSELLRITNFFFFVALSHTLFDTSSALPL